SILGSLSSGRPVMEDIIKGYEILGLNALIAVGGDGSLDIIYNIAKKGNWNLVAIPKTIDNDVPYTERSVGFDTAVNTVTKAIYDLTFTAASHERVMIVEVMGRDAGHLALHSGIAGGADIILIPELTPQLNESIVDQCCHKIAEIRSRNLRKFALIVIAEGVRNHERQRIKYIGDYLGSWIKSHSKELCGSGNKSFCDFDELDTRVTVLGHLQRSGTPSSFDRILATAFGIKAVNLIEEQKYYQLVVWRNGKVESESLDEVLPILRKVRTEKGCAYPVEPHGSMVETAKSLGIYVGND
ncbi:MAG TPA: ATP-dependent 6-phosphofructokinase, partial [Allocoleopsis sp.]